MIISIKNIPDDFPLDGEFFFADWQNGKAIFQQILPRYVPEILIAHRTGRGLTQDEVAKQVGLRRGSYSNIERGKCKPSVPVAKRIADVLGLEWTMFFAEGGAE